MDFPKTQEEAEAKRKFLLERVVLLEKLYRMVSVEPWPDEYSSVLTNLLEDLKENEKSLE